MLDPAPHKPADCECPRPPISLDQLPKGRSATILGCDTDPCREELRAMGFRPDVLVTACRLGRMCVYELCDSAGGRCRVGISRTLAMHVSVSNA